MLSKVIQYHSSVIDADAIGTSVVSLHEHLHATGTESHLLCSDQNLRLSQAGVMPASTLLGASMGTSIRPDDVLILHYSFFDETAVKLSQLPLKKILVYHNVTPGVFFRDAGMDWLGSLCDASRTQLAQIAQNFDAAVGDSDYNSRELSAWGFRRVDTIPVLYRWHEFRRPEIDAEYLLSVRRASDVNLLFVGRFVPNKRIERLIEMLQVLKETSTGSVRLHVVGKIWDQTYFSSLIAQAAERGVLDCLEFHRNVDGLRLRTLYAACDAFVSMSDHEGFMVPILEAFASGCPVVALNTSAVGETMGGAGLLIDAPDAEFAAGLVRVLVSDRDLRNKIVAGQAERAAELRPRLSAQRWVDKIAGVVRGD